MDWTAQADIIRRIIALLLALADLADRAAAASGQKRRRVLAILRDAEIVAQVAASARELGAPAQSEIYRPEDAAADRCLDTSADAANLAGRLRALALVWIALLAWMERAGWRTYYQKPRTARMRAMSVHAQASSLRPARARSRSPPVVP